MSSVKPRRQQQHPRPPPPPLLLRLLRGRESRIVWRARRDVESRVDCRRVVRLRVVASRGGRVEETICSCSDSLFGYLDSSKSVKLIDCYVFRCSRPSCWLACDEFDGLVSFLARRRSLESKIRKGGDLSGLHEAKTDQALFPLMTLKVLTRISSSKWEQNS